MVIEMNIAADRQAEKRIDSVHSWLPNFPSRGGQE